MSRRPTPPPSQESTAARHAGRRPLFRAATAIQQPNEPRTGVTAASYETITAAANQWPAPVWTEKAATDVAFERTIRVLLLPSISDGGTP